MHRSLIHVLGNVEDLRKINWAKYVIDGLIKGVELKVAMHGSDVGSCVVFLMVR